MSFDAMVLGLYVRGKIEKHGSPEQIVDRLKRKYPQTPSMWVSAEAISPWIYHRSLEGERWRTELRCR